MDIMRLLTRKLKSQSLEDDNYDESRRRTKTLLQRNTTAQTAECDSGTASDDDATGLKKEPRLDSGASLLNEGGVVQRQQDDTRSFPNQLATSFENCNPLMTSPNFVVCAVSVATKDCVFNAHAGRLGRGGGGVATPSGRLSAVSSDFERCSLDFEPSGSSSEMDCHSSEDELVSIYRKDKRKRREASPDDRSTSGDEEEPDCDRPPSPWRRRRRPGNGVSSACVGQKTTSSGFSSPRKRYRQTNFNSTTTTVQRPSLDLYKMQKTSISRRYDGCCNRRSRAVKVKSIGGCTQSTSPSVFCFRSISWTSS